MIFPAVGSGFGTTSAYSSSGGSVHAPYPRHTQYDQTPVALPPTSASSSLQGHSQQVSPLPSPARRTPSGQGLGVASQPMYSPAAHVYSASDPRPQGDMFEGSDPTGGNTLRESLPKDQNQYVDQEQTELESGGPAQISNSTAPPVIPVDSAADGSRKQQPAVPVSSNPGSPTEVSTGASTTAEQSPAPSIIHAPGPAPRSPIRLPLTPNPPSRRPPLPAAVYRSLSWVVGPVLSPPNPLKILLLPVSLHLRLCLCLSPTKQSPHLLSALQPVITTVTVAAVLIPQPCPLTLQ